MREAGFGNGQIVTGDAASYHLGRLENRAEDFGPDVLQRLRTGATLNVADYIQARHTQSVLQRQFDRFLSKYDLLLTPTTPIPAPPIIGPNAIEQARLLTRFTAPFNLTGLPALSLLCGFTSSGLPVGMQMVASKWSEAKLLRAAYTYEQACGWTNRKPPL